MLLAAGRGERMRPLTDATPKALLEAGGTPLVVRLIEGLAAEGFTELVINHAHLGAKIEAALGDGSRLGVRIRYSPERDALETAGGIANALALLGREPFLVVNADLFADYPFGRLRGALRAPDAQAHLVLVDNPPHHPDGDFVLAGNRVANEGAAKLTFSGIGVYRPELFRDITPATRAALAPLLRAAATLGRLTGEHYTGRWVDVGTPDRLARLDAELRGAGRA
jgi:N-acetyl-alpha-D-muramate 1-phosphate uridylyltransferase